MPEKDVSLSKKTIILLVFLCLIVVFLFRPSKRTSLIDVEGIVPVSESKLITDDDDDDDEAFTNSPSLKNDSFLEQTLSVPSTQSLTTEPSSQASTTETSSKLTSFSPNSSFVNKDLPELSKTSVDPSVENKDLPERSKTTGHTNAENINLLELSKPALKPYTENKDLYLNPPTQQWMQTQFEKALSDLDLHYSPLSKWSVCGMKTYYFPKINTIFTGTPKTGCSNWIEALLKAEGDLKKDLDPTMIKKVHGPISNRHRIPKTLTRYGDVTFRRAFSFTVVRNPWTRMVSGYRDKLSDEITQGGAKRSIGVKVVSEMRGIEPENVKLNDLYPTFAEYAAWLVKHRGNVNVHFSPQNETLCIPHAKYDMIIPLEYSGPLGTEVLRRIHADNTSVFGSYDKSSDPRLAKSALFAKQWLSELNSELVEELYDIFRTDFTLLNYSNFTHPDFPLPLYS